MSFAVTEKGANMRLIDADAVIKEVDKHTKASYRQVK